MVVTDCLIDCRTGSAPSSPEQPRKMFSFPPDVINNNRNNKPVHPSHAPVKVQTVTRPQVAPAAKAPTKALQGPLMNICKDCKTMIVNIIRASRSSLASAPYSRKEKVTPIDAPSRRANRNFHLDLKPVYK